MVAIFEINHQNDKSTASFFVVEKDYLNWILSINYLGGHTLSVLENIEESRKTLIEYGIKEAEIKVTEFNIIFDSSEKHIDQFRNSHVKATFYGTYERCLELFIRYRRLWREYLQQQYDLDPNNPVNQYPEHNSKNYKYFGYESEEEFIVYENIANNLSY